MSAWIVSKKHIDALVTAYLHSQYFDSQRTAEENDRIGQMLWDENHRSVNYRYKEAMLPPSYKFEPCSTFENKDGSKVKLDNIALCKLIDCYEYQTCEHKEWATSEACSFCNALRKRLVMRTDGYEDAPWGI
jgi:hypothetical protein